MVHLCCKRIEMNSFGTKDHLVESVCNTAKSAWVDVKDTMICYTTMIERTLLYATP